MMADIRISPLFVRRHIKQMRKGKTYPVGIEEAAPPQVIRIGILDDGYDPIHLAILWISR